MKNNDAVEAKEQWDFGRFRQSFDAIAQEFGDRPFSHEERSEADLREYYETAAARSIAEYAAETYEYLRGIL